MELSNRTPVFRNNQVEVTERAARRMGQLLVELSGRGIDKLVAQRFILQCVLAMFAEDRQLLPRDLFISCVQECMSGANSYDVLGGLFREMNRELPLLDVTRVWITSTAGYLEGLLQLN